MVLQKAGREREEKEKLAIKHKNNEILMKNKPVFQQNYLYQGQTKKQNKQIATCKESYMWSGLSEETGAEYG